jgi:hypothetical protein
MPRIQFSCRPQGTTKLRVQDTGLDLAKVSPFSIDCKRSLSPGLPIYLTIRDSVIADLRNFPAAGSGYYDPSGHMQHGAPQHAYPPPQHNAPNGYYQPQQPSSYGPVYYPVNHGADLGHGGGYDNRKRYDALNDFFGDAKRRQIDPTSYAEVGNRLTLLQGIPIQSGGMSEYMPAGPAMVSVGGHGGGGAPMAQHQYALPPMPNLRTKTDLLNIDQFLEQVQSTVYESSNSAAAAGVQQPGAHYTHTAEAYRHSHSPPQNLQGLGHMASQVSSAHSTAPMRATHSSQSNSSGTPALTPASSSVSFTSGHSPTSSQGLSPTSGHSTTSAPYPTLPADANGYSPHSTAAPASTLGTNFDSDFRRRYSGGMLQRSAYLDSSSTSRGALIDEDNDYSSTPTPTKANPEIVVHASAPAYPSTSSASSPEDSSAARERERAEEADRREEAWIENIRVIEALRRLISERLERKEYDDEEAEDVSMSGTAQQNQSQSLYPVLRADD